MTAMNRQITLWMLAAAIGLTACTQGSGTSATASGNATTEKSSMSA